VANGSCGDHLFRSDLNAWFDDHTETEFSSRTNLHTFTNHTARLNFGPDTDLNVVMDHHRATDLRVILNGADPDGAILTDRDVLPDSRFVAHLAWIIPQLAVVLSPMIAKELLDILVCPKCKGDLQYRKKESALDCAKCKLRYPIENDIPVMLIPEARPLA
jgi:uncharacterized protein